MPGCRRKPGRAKITPAFNLPCDYVLHTVGPIIRSWLTRKDKELLASCYRSCLELTDQNNIKSVAFCYISTGEFHFPNDKAAQVAVSTVKDYKEQTNSRIEVIFNVFKDVDFQIYRNDNEEAVRQMVEAQGYQITENGDFKLSDNAAPKMTIPSDLVPHCPICGAPMNVNLRCDDTFVEDEGWHKAAERYNEFIRRHENLHVLFLELGVGANTPVIIKYPFWRMTAKNPKAVHACINKGEAMCPREIKNQSICIDADIGSVIKQISETGKLD